MPRDAAQALLSWYDRHRRDLPWRRSQDPYAILVAELMLQQTRVEAVIPYYDRWMKSLPTLRALAASNEEDVLRLWEGLGYYRRAHNLLALAKQVVREHQGRLPESAAELERLPGVGRYTAAAVAAIAFNRNEIALDGNLRRVLSRWLDYEGNPRSPQGERMLRQGAQPLLGRGRPGDINQALMDLGATTCLPRQPHCDACALVASCRARRRGTQEERPLRMASKTIPTRLAAAGVIWRQGKVLVARRPRHKLLGGLWEFPGGKAEGDESIDQTLKRELREELDVEVIIKEPIGQFSHAYTHFRIEVVAFACRLAKGEPKPLEHTQLAWRRPAELARLPMGKIDRSIAQALRRRTSPGRRPSGRRR